MKTSKKPQKNTGIRKTSPDDGSEISKSESENSLKKNRFNDDEEEDNFDLLDDDITGFNEFNELDEDDY